MTTFVALYRGQSVATAWLVAVSADRQLVAHVADALLKDPADAGDSDPVQADVTDGRRRALERIRREVRSDRTTQLGGDAAAAPLEVVAGGRVGDSGGELDARVLAVLRQGPEGLSTRQVRGAVRGRDCEIDAALERLEAAGRAICAPGRRGALIWRAEGSRSGAAEKARPDAGPTPARGPAAPDAEPDGETRS